MYPLAQLLTPLTVSRALNTVPGGLPRTGVLALWYGGDGSGAGTYLTTAGNGQPVDSWLDYLGTRNVSQTGSARPTYRQSLAGYNNRGAVEFGSTQWLQGIATLVHPRTTYAIYAVGQSVSTQILTMYSEGHSTDTIPYAEFSLQPPGVRRTIRIITRGTGGVTATASSGAGTTISEANPYLLEAVRSGNTFTTFVDTVQSSTTSAAVVASVTNRIALMGNFRALSAQGQGTLACVAVYEDDSNQASVRSALNTHYVIY